MTKLSKKKTIIFIALIVLFVFILCLGIFVLPKLLTYSDFLLYEYSEEYDGYLVTRINEEKLGSNFDYSTIKYISVPPYYEGEPVVVIGYKAFSGFRTPLLEEVALPSTIKYIFEDAFEECTALKKINLPRGLEGIGIDAFDNCNSLPFEIEGGLKYYQNWLIEADEILTEYTIRKGTVGIAAFSFYQFYSTERINIPESVKYITPGAFAYSGITSIQLPENIKRIPNSTFSCCTSLAEIVIPEGITAIGDECFSGCTNVTKVVIPATLTEIGNSAFKFHNIKYPGSDLESIEVSPENPIFYSTSGCLINRETKTLLLGCNGAIIPRSEDITTIASYAFVDRTLSEIVIPDTITTLDNFCFYAITVTDNPTLVIPGNIEFLGYNILDNAKGIKKLVIEEGVREIRSSVFINMDDLEEVYLHKSLAHLHKYNFRYCDTLKNIYSIGGISLAVHISLNNITPDIKIEPVIILPE